MKPKYRRLLRNPTSLKVVAGLCFFCGIVALAKTLYGFTQAGCILDVGLLGFFAAFGLLWNRNGWRIAVLIFSGLSVFMHGVVLLFAVASLFSEPASPQPAPLIMPTMEEPLPGMSDTSDVTVKRFGVVSYKTPGIISGYPVLGVLAGLVSMMLYGWVMFVLLRPEIRALFITTRDNEPAA